MTGLEKKRLLKFFLGFLCLRGNYRDMDTTRYAFNIAIFHVMQCIMSHHYLHVPCQLLFGVFFD